jgi:hypothetical protein
MPIKKMGQITNNRRIRMKISDQLINSILGYLGTRPYQEVYQLIDAVQKEARDVVPVDPPAETPTE